MANLEATFIAPDNHPTSAGSLRALVKEMFAGSGGIGSGRLRGMGVAPADPEAGFALTVDAGSGLVPTDDGLGAYFVTSYAPETIPWPPAGGQGRVDSLVLSVADSDYGTIPATLGASWQVVQGVAAASPVALSDEDLSAALGTPGGHLRWVDVSIPPAPQEAITGNLITGRYAQVRPALRSQLYYVSTQQAPNTAGSWLPLLVAQQITVPPSGRIAVTVSSLMASNLEDSAVGLSFATTGALTSSAGWNRSAIVWHRATSVQASDRSVLEGMTPGAVLSVQLHYYLVPPTSQSARFQHTKLLLEQLP